MKFGQDQSDMSPLCKSCTANLSHILIQSDTFQQSTRYKFLNRFLSDMNLLCIKYSFGKQLIQVQSDKFQSHKKCNSMMKKSQPLSGMYQVHIDYN